MKRTTSSRNAAKRASVKHASAVGKTDTGAPSKVGGRRPKVSRSLAAALQPFVDAGTLAGAVLLLADRNTVLAIVTVGVARGPPQYQPTAMFHD